jgi:hypothetical protein
MSRHERRNRRGLQAGRQRELERGKLGIPSLSRAQLVRWNAVCLYHGKKKRCDRHGEQRKMTSNVMKPVRLKNSPRNTDPSLPRDLAETYRMRSSLLQVIVGSGCLSVVIQSCLFLPFLYRVGCSRARLRRGNWVLGFRETTLV